MRLQCLGVIIHHDNRNSCGLQLCNALTKGIKLPTRQNRDIRFDCDGGFHAKSAAFSITDIGKCIDLRIDCLISLPLHGAPFRPRRAGDRNDLVDAARTCDRNEVFIIKAEQNPIRCIGQSDRSALEVGQGDFGPSGQGGGQGKRAKTKEFE